MQPMTSNFSLDAAKCDLIASLGFPTTTEVGSLLTIAHLFGASKNRCGIYCLAFSSGQFYIGQAVDVVRRFVQHRHNYSDIIGFAFIPVQKAKLNDTEKALIYKAESIGVVLKNVIHVTSVIGDTDLDLLFPLTEQNVWLASVAPSIQDASNASPKIVLPESQQVRFSSNFERFCSHPLHAEATALLKQYLSSCIPAPRLTEYSFWSVSCMPSTNKNTWPRLCCVNAASMELFVTGWDKNDGTLWSFLTIDEEVLTEYWPDPGKFSENFPFVEYFDAGYRDAGQNQVTLRGSGKARMDLLLQDTGICRAAAALSLRVMRKRPNFYMQFHCTQLANLALSKTTSA